MNDPMIVASGKASVRRDPVGSTGVSRAGALLGWIGLVFLIVGGADFLLVWFPLSFGTREWEFATVTQSFNGLPILLLGLGFLLVGSEQVERRWWAYVAMVSAAALLLWVLAGFGLWASNVGLAMDTVPEELKVGIRKAVWKTALQGVAYSVVLGYLLRWGWVGLRQDAEGT